MYPKKNEEKKITTINNKRLNKILLNYSIHIFPSFLLFAVDAPEPDSGRLKIGIGLCFFRSSRIGGGNFFVLCLFSFKRVGFGVCTNRRPLLLGSVLFKYSGGRSGRRRLRLLVGVLRILQQRKLKLGHRKGKPLVHRYIC